MKKKIFLTFFFVVFAITYIKVFDPYDLQFKLRKKAPSETNYKGCALGVSNKLNQIQHDFLISNIYYLFEDKFPFELVNQTSEKNITMITWEPFDKKDKKQNILPDIARGKFDKHISSFALDVKKFSKPLILRFAHEMNGDWYPWSGKYNNKSSQNFIESYRRIYSIFKKHNIQNVFFAFSVNNEDVPNESWNNFENYYPGDDVVDIILIDAYKWSKYNLTPKQLIKKSYERIIKSFPQKMIGLGEVGASSQKIDKEAWVQDFFVLIKERFPAIRTVIWFDMIKEEDWGFSHDPHLKKYFSKLNTDSYYSIDHKQFIRMFKDDETGTLKSN